MQNPAEHSHSSHKQDRSPSLPIEPDSFNLQMLEKDPVKIQRFRTSKISISTIDDAPAQDQRPDLPHLDDLGENESGFEQISGAQTDEILSKTSTLFNEKMHDVVAIMNQEIQISLQSLKENQALRAKQIEEELEVLNGVNQHSKALTKSLAENQQREKLLRKKYDSFIESSGADFKRLASEKSDLFLKINQTENKVIELKNEMAELEVANYQKKLEGTRLQDSIENVERVLNLKFKAQISELEQKVEDSARRLKDETGEKNHWKQLYEDLQKKFNDKIEYDIKVRKSEIERAHLTQSTINDQSQEIENLKEQLRNQENEAQKRDLEHQSEMSALRSKMKEMEKKYQDELGKIRDETESLASEKAKSVKLLEERNVEISQLELKIEEVYKLIQGLESEKAALQLDKDKQLQKLQRENETLRMMHEPDQVVAEECESISKPAMTSGTNNPHPDYDVLLDRIEELTDELEKKKAQLEQERATRFQYEAQIKIITEKLKEYKAFMMEQDALKDKLLKLEEENKTLYSRIIELTNRLAQKDNELNASGKYVFELKQQLELSKNLMKSNLSTPKQISPPKKMTVYKATDPTDEIDLKFSQILNFTGCPVPITRIGNGVYMFGNRRIKATMQGGRLVIRVGGGFMVVEEFVQTYGQQEHLKMQQLALKDKKSRQQSLQKGLSMEQSRSLSKDCIKSPFGLNKVKSKPTFPNVEVTSQSRRNTYFYNQDSARCYETPLKSDRLSKKNKLLESSSQSSSKRMISQVDINTLDVKQSMSAIKSESDLLNPAFNHKSKFVIEEFPKKKKKNRTTIVDNTFSEGLIASLADQNTNPKLIRDHYKKIKGDSSINGSARIRNLNRTEKDAISKIAGSANKKTKERAIKGVSKSMMIHDRKFSTSEEVEECGALFEYDQ